METELLKLLLPSELFEHFELVGVEDNVDYFVFKLDEKNHPPRKHNHTYTSKGFFERVEIQDFPLRGKPVYLRVRKRKWLEEQTGAIVSNRFTLTQPGTHLNPQFAAFLKEQRIFDCNACIYRSLGGICAGLGND
jgi:hypothetical protein